MTPDELLGWFPDGFTEWSPVVQCSTIALLTFVSEDLTCVGSALFAALGELPLGVAWLGSFIGIWLGDALLYGIARFGGARAKRSSWLGSLLASEKVREAESWFRDRGWTVLWVCRWVPGTRLPSYLAAGYVRLPILPFLAITGFMAFLWTVVIFTAAMVLGASIGGWIERFENGVGAVIVLTLLTVVGFRLWQRSRWWPSRRSLETRIQRWIRWEFWPAWLFYLPVAGRFLWLSIKYRGVAVPALANPGIETGGLIGESKIVLLNELMKVAPEHTAAAYEIKGATPKKRMADFESIMRRNGLQFPVIIKPDVGQRGSGVKKISSTSEAADCLLPDGFQRIVQSYASGPHEAGVFYYRFPGEAKGQIFAITHKVFPEVEGDGTRTVEELIHSDSRASLMADVYCRRLGEGQNRVLAKGETLRLVESGNHAQGCVFLDGMSLCSEELVDQIDRISQGIDGFFVGRYDLRYRSERDLCERAEFQIVELNGASAEATSIYDPQFSLWQAYRTLFAQWEIVFAIGAVNRAQGVRAPSGLELLRLWIEYQRQSRAHPLAD